MDIQQVHQLHMKSGCVLNFKCAVPGSTNPFTGSISFKNVFFPKNRKEYLLEGPQPYRNIRHHLRNIENGMMANLFHSAELAVEREDDKPTDKIISYAYELFSDFGSSAGRAIGSWFFLGFLVTFILFVSDGAIQAFTEATKYPGWKSFLINYADCWQNDLRRSFYLSFQNMLNPLSLFGIKILLVAKNGWLAIILAIQGLLSAILIALMIFAIRRRFKMG